MKKQLILFVTLASLLIPTYFIGKAQANELGICFTDNLTGKEKKNLAKWIFFVMSEHPEISSYSSANAEDKEEIYKFVGQLVTRLLTEDCPMQTKNAVNQYGQRAIKDAFGVVVQVAMQEVMMNENVTKSGNSFEKYLDKEKIQKLGQ
jgi:hypothetical protein